MAVKYPVRLQDDEGTVLVTFVDYPGATYGKDKAEALMRAVDALETLFMGSIEHRQEIPNPSAVRKDQPCVILPALSEAKVALYRALQKAGIGKAELARRLSWHLPQVDRLLDLKHNSRLDQIEQAFAALGKQLSVHVSDAT
jgi:antitoxin HicB